VTDDGADSGMFRVKVPDTQLYMNKRIRGMNFAVINKVWTCPECNSHDGY